MRRVIERALARWTRLNVRDYPALLNVEECYDVGELEVEQESWLSERALGDLRLQDEGVAVLAVRRRDGHFLGVPGDDVVLEVGDALIVYGRDARADTGARRAPP